MALVPATIDLNWISNYNGPHRVCYRIVGAPTYTCTAPGTPGPGFHPLCGGGGIPCSYTIDILVDNETCAQVDYEGYIQAACEDELSLIGRDPFTISFIPDPACNRYEVTCVDSPILNVTLVDGGSGYTNGTYPGLASIGGGGTGATFDVTVALGTITVITMITPGSGYTSAPTIDLSSIPYVAGIPLTYSVNLTGCTALTIYDCSGVTGEILPLSTFQPTEVYDMCGSSVPTVPADYTVVESGNCLCNCETIDVQTSFDGGSIDVTYIACNGAVVTEVVTFAAPLGPVCMVAGSLDTVVNAPAIEVIVNTGACDAVAP